MAFRALVADSAAYMDAGDLAQARAAIDAAMQLQPNHPVALHNLGVIEAIAGRPAIALAAFDRAIAAHREYAAAHFHRAMALKGLGRLPEARASLLRACSIEPDYYSAHREMALCSLALGERDSALDHLARTYELRRGECRTGIAQRSLTHTSALKLRHDAEQFRHIARAGRDPRRFAELADIYEQVAGNYSRNECALRAADLELLGDTYNAPIQQIDAPEIPGGALASADDPGTDPRLTQVQSTEVTVIDRLLKPGALESLRRYLLLSTIWHDFAHIRGFVASYLEDGLACPLLLQIADDLRGAYPARLSGLALTQAWAFKAMEPEAAIDAHADDAAVSLNFWITPETANLQPTRGGMSICLEPPPADWAPRDYSGDLSRAVPFLEQRREQLLTVPYRDNRAVLFSSRLLHRSDAPRFADSYENRRINITMLFAEQRGTQASERLGCQPSGQ